MGNQNGDMDMIPVMEAHTCDPNLVETDTRRAYEVNVCPFLQTANCARSHTSVNELECVGFSLGEAGECKHVGGGEKEQDKV